nr:hypothetical protein [Tanacetum cinerariifolium]
MLVAREPEVQSDAEEQGAKEEQGNADTAAEEPETVVPEDAVKDQPIPSPTPLTPPPQQPQDEADGGREYTTDTQVEGRQADIYHIDMDHAAKVLSMQEDESEVQEAVEVVTTAKLITKVVVAVSEIVSVAAVIPFVVPETISAAAAVPTIIAPPVKIEESSAKTPTETSSKDKGKGILVEEPKPIKKKQQVELDEMYARKLQEEINQDIDWEAAMDNKKPKRNLSFKDTKLDYFKGMTYDDIRPIFVAKLNANMEFLLKSHEQIDEETKRAIESIN